MLRFHRTHYLSDVFFSFTSTLADAMHSMDVSRVLRTCLFHIPAPHITCHRLMYSYVSFPSYVFSLMCMCVRIWTVDSSPDTCLLLKSHVHPVQYVDRVRTSMRYLQTTCSVDLVIVLFRVDNTCHRSCDLVTHHTLCCI